MELAETAGELPAADGSQTGSVATMACEREETAGEQRTATAPPAGPGQEGSSERDSPTRRDMLSSGMGRAAAAGAGTTLGVVLMGFAGTATAEAKAKHHRHETKKRKKKKKVSTSSSSSSKKTINVNGQNHTVEVPSETPLLYVLRNNLNLRGPKFGCGLLECGACAVLNNGKQIRSCQTDLEEIKSTDKIVTLDGLADSYHGKGKVNGLHPLQQAWIEEQVPQCGYCQNGQIIQAAALLNENKNPTKEEIKKNMNGHLCRCGTYNAILRAVVKASEAMS